MKKEVSDVGYWLPFCRRCIPRISVSPLLVSETQLLRASLEYVLGAYLVWLQALREFGAIVKNKQYPQAGRLRANMGNIYYEQVPRYLDPLWIPYTRTH